MGMIFFIFLTLLSRATMIKGLQKIYMDGGVLTVEQLTKALQLSIPCPSGMSGRRRTLNFFVKLPMVDDLQRIITAGVYFSNKKDTS